MNIEAFLLCDAATEQQGKLNVLGSFDSIWTKALPTKHPACAVALRIRFDKIEEGKHPFKLRIIDEDGQSIGPQLDGNVDVQMPPNVESIITNFILNIQGLEFKKYGQYRIDFAINGQSAASLPFYVREQNVNM